jgi:hypothetical protein
MHLPFLSKVYEHSPVNTSPPFSLPPDIAQLQKAAKDKGDDLGVNVGRLQTVFFYSFALENSLC